MPSLFTTGSLVNFALKQLSAPKNGLRSAYFYDKQTGKDLILALNGFDINHDRSGMESPFGITQYNQNSTARRDFLINVESKELQESLLAFNNWCINYVFTQKDSFWPRNDYNRRDIERMFVKPYIHKNISRTGKEYPPCLKTKVNETGQEEYRTKIFKVNGHDDVDAKHVTMEPCSPDAVVPHCKCLAEVRFSSIYIKNGSWGVSITVKTIAILNAPVVTDPTNIFNFGDKTVTMVTPKSAQSQSILLKKRPREETDTTTCSHVNKKATIDSETA
jgi:hypothetical protein